MKRRTDADEHAGDAKRPRKAVDDDAEVVQAQRDAVAKVLQTMGGGMEQVTPAAAAAAARDPDVRVQAAEPAATDDVWMLLRTYLPTEEDRYSLARVNRRLAYLSRLWFPRSEAELVEAEGFFKTLCYALFQIPGRAGEESFVLPLARALWARAARQPDRYGAFARTRFWRTIYFDGMRWLRLNAYAEIQPLRSMSLPPIAQRAPVDETAPSDFRALTESDVTLLYGRPDRPDTTWAATRINAIMDALAQDTDATPYEEMDESRMQEAEFFAGQAAENRYRERAVREMSVQDMVAAGFTLTSDLVSCLPVLEQRRVGQTLTQQCTRAAREGEIQLLARAHASSGTLLVTSDRFFPSVQRTLRVYGRRRRADAPAEMDWTWRRTPADDAEMINVVAASLGDAGDAPLDVRDWLAWSHEVGKTGLLFVLRPGEDVFFDTTFTVLQTTFFLRLYLHFAADGTLTRTKELSVLKAATQISAAWLPYRGTQSWLSAKFTALGYLRERWRFSSSHKRKTLARDVRRILQQTVEVATYSSSDVIFKDAFMLLMAPLAKQFFKKNELQYARPPSAPADASAAIERLLALPALEHRLVALLDELVAQRMPKQEEGARAPSLAPARPFIDFRDRVCAFCQSADVTHVRADGSETFCTRCAPLSSCDM